MTLFVVCEVKKAHHLTHEQQVYLYQATHIIEGEGEVEVMVDSIDKNKSCICCVTEAGRIIHPQIRRELT